MIAATLRRTDLRRVRALAVAAVVVASTVMVAADARLTLAASTAPVITDPVVAIEATDDGSGWWVARAQGRVSASGTAVHHGDLAGTPLAAPIVGMARTPSGGGYWLLGADGGVFSFGDAAFHGSTGGIRLSQPVVSMAPTPSGDGYWVVAADGGVFSFGDAAFHGSTGGIRLNQAIRGLVVSGSGDGYWMVAADGGVFAFGDAGFLGSTGGAPPADPVVALAPTPSHRGYWLATASGRVAPFGDAARDLGDGVDPAAVAPVVAMAANPDRPGYALVRADGTVVTSGSFGAARTGGPAVRSWPESWRRAGPAPSRRYEAASVVVGGRVILFGGYLDASFRVDRSVVAYDPAAGTWTRLGELPAGMAETHLAIATDGVHVYLAGGFAGDIRDQRPSQVIDDDLWRYTPADGTWARLGSLPEPRGAGTLALVGRTLHHLGGNLADRVTNAGDHWTYDLDTGAWGSAALLPDPRDHLSSAVLGGRLYTLGGEHGHDELNEQQDDLHVYEPSTDTWRQLAPLPAATSHAEGQTLVSDGRIVVAGGQVGSFAPTDRVLAYDPAADAWATWEALPAVRQGAAVHRVGSLVVVTTGAVRPNDPQSATWIGHLD